MLPLIHSYDSWTQLEEVWLGDVYPLNFYDHLESEVRDVFYRITEITQQDLNSIESTLRQLGVKVQRPQYQTIDQYINPKNGHLVKPQICPRDHHVTLGATLYLNYDNFTTLPWQHIINQYAQDDKSRVKINLNQWFCGANTVRVGRDVILDCIHAKQPRRGQMFVDEFINYRITVLDNGGHLDACFAILKPGLLLTNSYYDRYDETFPNWTRIHLADPSYYDIAPMEQGGRDGKFWDFGVNTKIWDASVPANNSFNQHITKYALDWVGAYTETYFELNCLVINERTVVMLGGSEKLAEELAQHDINIHWVPFRTRTFWDGGVHCLTLDIRRQGLCKDYFLSK